MKRKKSYGTATYNGIDYSVYDALPKHNKVWILIKTDAYIMDCYPNEGESLDEYFNRTGYNLKLLTAWDIV